MTKAWRFYIITPSYNQAQFIAQAVESVLNQSEVKTQLLVMDGGSTDGTIAVLKKHTRSLRWLSKKDGGQSDALNQGLKKVLAQVSDAELENSVFAYINSDDYYLPDAFKKVLQVFSDNPEVSWVVGECQIVDQNGKPIQSLIQLYKSLWRKMLSFKSLLILNPIPQPAVFMKLSAVKKVGLFNEKLHFTMDYEYWLRMWQAVGKPYQLAETLAAFRIHTNAKGSQNFTKQFAEQLEVARTFTKNQTWLFLQTLHNRMITFCYQLIK